MGFDIDRNNLLLNSSGNITFVATDVTDDASELYTVAADVVHSRFLYAHLADRSRLVQHLFDQVLKPGGVLILGDAYFCSPEDTPHPAVRAYLRGYYQLAKDQGTDFSWIRKVPVLFAKHGVMVELYSTPTHLGVGHDHWLAMITAFENQLIQGGYNSEEEIIAAKEALLEPGSYDSPQIIFTVVVANLLNKKLPLLKF